MVVKYAHRSILLTVALLFYQAAPLRAAAVRTVAGTTANTLAANDDGSTAAVPIGFPVNFFGVSKTTLFVNNNGNVTFNNALGAFTPTGISTSVNQPMIAPFFADVDTRGKGSGLVQYGNGTLCGRTVFGVNWIKVGYFASHVDKLNSFQLLLIDRSDTGAGNFDIEMNYDVIQWETGDASSGKGGLGGVSVEAGYTNGLAGAARVSYEFPGSRKNGAMLDGGPNSLTANKLAANTAGRYHFTVRGGSVVTTGGPTTSTATEVTSGTKVIFPIRYVFNNTAGTFSGPVTLARPAVPPTVVPKGPTGPEACLDLLTTAGPVTPKVVVLSPITIVFAKLPANVTLATATPQLTTKGYPYLTIPGSTLEPGQSLRFPIALRNPKNASLSSTFIHNSFNLQIIAGPFDPTKY